MLHAVSEIEVDEILIGNAGVLRHALEIGDDIRTHANGHLLFQAGCIGITPLLHAG